MTTMENLLILIAQRNCVDIINLGYSKIELRSWNINTTSIQGASTLTVVNGKAEFNEVTLLSYPGRQKEYLKVVIQ
jgi:hypothetical protein